MKAIVWTRYGPADVLLLQDVPKPTPKPNEILIKIAATTVTAGDCELRNLDFAFFFGLAIRLWRGVLKPRGVSIFGTELSGEVESVGKAVTKFTVGDKVFGSAGLNFGANAEYICLPEVPGDLEGGVAIMPTNMTFSEAAAVPFGGRDALHFLRKANIQPGQKILILGAGGSIGTFGVQLAKYYGAEVTSVDSTAKLDMLRSIGSDHVIDYTQEDFTDGDERYDVIFDVVGKINFTRGNKVLKKNGCYLLANSMKQLVRGNWISKTNSRKVVMGTASGTIDDLLFLRQLVEERKLKTVIDRSYPLEQIVEAHRYIETGDKKGM